MDTTRPRASRRSCPAPESGLKVVVAAARGAAARRLATALQRGGFVTVVVRTVAELSASLPDADLAVVAPGLPDGDGLEACVRERDFDGGIVVVCDQAEELARVDLLDRGADAVLTRPVSARELRARARALTRRRAAAIRRHHPRIGFDTRRGVHLVDDRPVRLAKREAQLLTALLRVEGAVADRSWLEAQIWAPDLPPQPRTLDAVVARLRRRLAEYGWPNAIRNVRTIGFRLESE